MIHFITMEGKIEESAGRRKFYLLPEETILEYEKRMLCDGECPYTLPMSFLTEDGTEAVYYDFTGYMQVEDYIKKKSASMGRNNQKLLGNALELLSGILSCMKGMESYMLFPERFSNHPDTIFIHLNTGRPAFAYFPNDRPKETLQSRIIQMIEEMNGMYCDAETEQYFRRFIDFIHNKNPGLDGMISLLGTIQREVSYIYWNAKDLRRAEEKETTTMEPEPPLRVKYNFSWKPYLLHGMLAAGLVAVYLTERLELTSFAGLSILAAGLDLWIMKKFFFAK